MEVWWFAINWFKATTFDKVQSQRKKTKPFKSLSGYELYEVQMPL